MKTYLKTNWVQLFTVLLILGALSLGWQPDAAQAAGLSLVGVMLNTALAPFPVTPELTAVAIAYRNQSLIADSVLPRVPVGAQAFKYMLYPKGSYFQNIDTSVGRKGTPQQVEFTGTETDSSTVDQALDDGVPIADIENARAMPGLPDPLMRATEGIQELLALRREVRAAALVFAQATYASGNRVQLTGNDQWSSTDAASQPIDDIMTGIDSCVMRPNVMVLGNAVSSKLRRHATIVKAYNGTTGDTGMVPLQFLADLFELEEVIVGQGWVNTAAKGQAVSLSRVWGKHCALLYRNKRADNMNGITFGFTAQWGPRFAGSQYDKDIGMRGGQIVRSGESVKEVVTASDLGYYIEDAIA